jgi:hypothetical protein
MTYSSTKKADPDPQFSRDMLIASLIEAAFLLSGAAVFYLTRELTYALAIALPGMAIFLVLLMRAQKRAKARKAAGGADPIVQGGRGPF